MLLVTPPKQKTKDKKNNRLIKSLPSVYIRHLCLFHYTNCSFSMLISVSLSLCRVLHKGTSEYQDIALLDTKRFGKVYAVSFYNFVRQINQSHFPSFIGESFCKIHPTPPNYLPLILGPPTALQITPTISI